MTVTDGPQSEPELPTDPPPEAESSALAKLFEEWERLDAEIRAHLGDRYDL
ncbi:hypothetical protein [Streptomyces sp. RFCAC02]|uniref:hypothetical protein n=1 Tax=Streptomyces sp. RFCAC02 TaxID=2499143 RepID=UPI00143CF5DD|nr:hypothetical protein [Streptomyces sp. RFCAC02]